MKRILLVCCMLLSAAVASFAQTSGHPIPDPVSKPDFIAKVAELNTLLTAARSSPELERRNAEWRLGLVRPSDPQIVRVAAAEAQRYAARRETGLLTDTAPAAPQFSLVSAPSSVRFAVNTRTR